MAAVGTRSSAGVDEDLAFDVAGGQAVRILADTRQLYWCFDEFRA
jgi:uncharacterized protein YgiM (DUF1202 family)